MPKHRTTQLGEIAITDSVTKAPSATPAHTLGLGPATKRLSPITLLKNVLHHWHRPAAFAKVGLERHPAIHQLLTAQASATIAEDFSTQLRSILLDAINHLKPDPAAGPLNDTSDPRWRDNAWRPYLALQVAYLDPRLCTLSHERRAALLFCSSSTFYQLRQQAVQKLDEALQQAATNIAARPSHLALSEAGNAYSAASLPIAWVYAAPPKRLAHFVGREALLAKLSAEIAAAQQHRSAKTVALWGTPGMGKTALLTHIAHDEAIKQQFLDGVLWASLGETDEHNTSHLLTWASALGLPIERFAQGLILSEVSRVLSNVIGNRRTLFIVDDVWSEATLEPFNIVGPNCVLVFATRSAELAHRLSSSHALQVEELDQAATVELMIDIAPRAIQYEPIRVEQLLTRLAGWPQAVHLAATQLRQAYGESQRRLREKLDALLTMPHWDTLAAIIDTSVSRLPTRLQDLLFALSAFPAKPVSFAESAARAIGACEYADLDLLIDAGLVEIHTSPSAQVEQRLMIHQSVLDYARTKLNECETDVRRNTQMRFIQHFCDFARDNAHHYGALSAEGDPILRAIILADEAGFDSLYVPLVIAFVPFLKSRGQLAEAMRFLHAAYAAAQRLNDTIAMIQIANELSQGHMTMSDSPQAAHWARVVLQHSDDAQTEPSLRCKAIALDTLAEIATRAQDQTTAIRYAQQAWQVAKACGAQHVLERQLLRLQELPQMDFTPIAAPTAGELQAQLLAQWQQAGIAYVKDTDLRSARNHLLGALANARLLGVPDYLVNTLGFLTLMHCTLGEFDQAIATSAEVFRIGGNAQSNFPRGYGFAAAFGTLAHLHRGQPEAAKQCMLHGQQIAEMLNAPEAHVWVCFAAASYFLDQGELQLADAQAQLAVLHCQTGNITDSLATMWGMCGRVATAKRDFASAATYFQKAQENVYNELQATYAQADAGLMAEASGDYAQAERLLRPALDFHIRTCVWRYVPLIGWGLARVLAATGQLDEARITALRALQCAREIHDVRVNPIRRWLNTLH